MKKSKTNVSDLIAKFCGGKKEMPKKPVLSGTFDPEVAEMFGDEETAQFLQMLRELQEQGFDGLIVESDETPGAYENFSFNQEQFDELLAEYRKEKEKLNEGQ